MKLQIGVKLIIESSKGEILLLKRAGHEELDGLWDVPGGRIEPHEDMMSALHREVYEEIGVDFDGIPELIAAQDIFPAKSGVHVVRLTYRLKQNITPVLLSDEHSEFRYVSYKDAKILALDPLILEVLI